MATTTTATTTARRAPADKHDERRKALAESALVTLGELGYARTSLREIANNSEFSHGVVHYYFHDKLELIVYCVRHYKQTCVRRYDGVIADSQTPEGLVEAFGAKLCETIVQEAPMHRLWYDLRSQSMFDEALRADVLDIDRTLEDMVWRVIARYAELLDLTPTTSPGTAYGILDGLFQQALLGYLAQGEKALAGLASQVAGVMGMLSASWR